MFVRLFAWAVIAAHILLSTIVLSAEAFAQDYPLGACILPDGAWCLPSVPAAPGDPCYCLTDIGWAEGFQL